MQVFLMAERNSDASALVARRLSTIQKDSERVAVLDTLLKVYIERARPTPSAAIDSLVPLYESIAMTVDPLAPRLIRYSKILNQMQSLQDTVRARRYAELIVKYGRVNRELLNQDAGLRTFVFAAQQYLDEDQSLNSIRQGNLTDWVKKLKQDWTMGDTTIEFPLPMPIGNLAPNLVGQRFAPAGISLQAGQLPVRGNVSLVVFVNSIVYGNGSQKNYMTDPWAGADGFATIRRLKRQFPDLDLILVADHPPTFFGARSARDTIQQREWWRQWLLDYQRIPATLVVENTATFTIPDPADRRVIILRAANPTAYRGKLGVQGTSMMAFEGFLVARTGHIVAWVSGVTRHREGDLIPKIKAALEAPRPETSQP
jgi:hypothetical protein